MSDFMNLYFGPLNKDSCDYFLVLSIIFFILLVTTIFGQIYIVIKDYKQLNFSVISGGIMMIFNLFIAYFVNRLLYTMCSKTL